MILVTTLPFGFKKPQTGDKGATVFDALEDNIDRVDAHSHDNVDSPRVESFDLSRGTVAVASSGWSASGNFFKQTVTFPSGFSVANASEYTKASIKFYFDGGANDNQECFPKTNRLTDTTFELFSLVSNQAFTVTFV